MGDVVERIIIEVDSAGAVVGARRAAGAMKEVEAAAGSTGRTAAKTGGVMRTAVGLGLVFAAQKAIEFGKSSVTAFRNSEAAQRAANVTLMHSGIAWRQHRAEILKTLDAHEKLYNFDRIELLTSFSRIAAATHNTAKAFSIQTIAMNIARERNLSLADATQILVRIYNGQTRGAKALGVAFQNVTDAQQKLHQTTKHATAEQKAAAKATDQRATSEKVLELLSARFAGQALARARSQAGAADALAVEWDHAQRKLGKALIPTMRELIAIAVPVLGLVARNAKAFALFAVGLTAAYVAVKLVTGAQKAWDAAQTVGSAIRKLVLTETVAQTTATEAQAAATSAQTALTASQVEVLASLGIAETDAGVATAALTEEQIALDVAMTANPIGIVIVALAALAAGFAIAWSKSKSFRDAMTAVWNALKTAVMATIGWVRSHWPIIFTIIAGPFAPLVALATNAFGIRSAFIGAIQAVWAFVKRIVGAIVDFFTGLPAKFKAALAGLAAILIAPFAALLSTLGAVRSAISTTLGAFRSAASFIGSHAFSNTPVNQAQVTKILGKGGGIQRSHAMETFGPSPSVQVALAQLTPGTDDDLAAYRALEAEQIGDLRKKEQIYKDTPKYQQQLAEAKAILPKLFAKLKKAQATVATLVKAKAKPKTIAIAQKAVGRLQRSIRDRQHSIQALQSIISSAEQDVISAAGALQSTQSSISGLAPSSASPDDPRYKPTAIPSDLLTIPTESYNIDDTGGSAKTTSHYGVFSTNALDIAPTAFPTSSPVSGGGRGVSTGRRERPIDVTITFTDPALGWLHKFVQVEVDDIVKHAKLRAKAGGKTV